ncbi:MAG: Ig-like domain-containing protein [Lachnospiraceae bacterium]|nr:Ig-like domain-containing protein [Lachnospiraceae bacterium]
MMKSFFKKLSLVMAAAMVVSTAAPAAQTAYAASDLKIAKQNVKEAIASINVGVGESVDLWYLGAPKNYKELNPTWSSDLEAVAKVDQKGNVTGVAAGVATISIALSDGSEAEVAVTVGEPVVYDVVLGTAKDDTFSELTLALDEAKDLGFFGVKDWKASNYVCEWSVDGDAVTVDNKTGVVTAVAPGTATVNFSIKNKTNGVAHKVTPVIVTVPEIVNTYTVKQINHNKVTLTFAENVEFTADDVVLNKMYDGEEVFWPIQNVVVDANTITYETYVSYEDGEDYVVRVGAEDEGTSYTTTIGEVAQVKLAYGTSKDAKGNVVYPNKAYSNGEDGDDLIVYLSTKLYNKFGVDVTGYYKTDDVVYELAEENENVMIDNYSGEVVFYAIGVPAVITATYTYYDNDGEQHDIVSIATPVISEKAPAYGIKSVDAWAVVKDGTPAWEINWNNHEIMAEDDVRADYHIVVKFTDTNGNQYITDEAYADPASGLYSAISGEYDFADKGNYVTFSSSNTNKLLVGEDDGDLTTSDKTKVAVILTLHNYDSDKEDFFVKNVSAFQVNVNAKRKVTSVALNTNSTTVITDSNEPGFTTRYVEAYVYDQYNTKWYEDVALSFSTSVEGAPDLADVTYVANDKATITVDGRWYDSLNKQTVSYTVKEANQGKTATLKVVVKNPKLDEGDIKITSYSVVAGNVDMRSNWWEPDNKSTMIHYYELSNSVEVGHRDDIQLITSADDLRIEEVDTAKGAQYVVIYDCNGNVVPATGGATKIASGSALVEELQSGEYKLHVSELAEDGRMDYAPTGTYTVKVLEVRDFSKGVAVFRTKYEKTFDVSNTNDTLTLRNQENVDVTVKIDEKYFAEGNEFTYAQKMKAAINDVVDKAFRVNKAGSEWDFAPSDILKVDYKINEGQTSVIIRSVTFKVPLATGNGTYEYKLNINRAVDVTLTK